MQNVVQFTFGGVHPLNRTSVVGELSVDGPRDVLHNECMTTIALDSYQFVQALTKAGMPETQAEAVVRQLRQVSLRDAASTADVAELKLRIEQIKTELLKWLIPLLLGQVAVFAALVKWLLR